MQNQAKNSNLFNKIEENSLLLAIRNGLVLAIPAILCGSMALLLLSLPIPVFQHFLHSAFHGMLVDILTMIQQATIGLISLILLLTISHSYEQLLHPPYHGIMPIVSLCSYIAFTCNRTEDFSFAIFQSTWLFNAIFVAILASLLFTWFYKYFSLHTKTYTDGADTAFNAVVSVIIPFCLVVFCFSLLNIVMVSIFGIPNFQTVISDFIYTIFTSLGRTLGSGLLFILCMHLMWFFGIHGSNVLDDVAKGIFGHGMDINAQLIQAGQMPTEILTKTFFDTFVLFGGCGTLTCLVVAIFLFEHRKNVRELTKMATIPLLFNINELMVFGIPIVLNPVYLIPFIVTPLVLTITSFLATTLGLVPYATHSVEWTTPIFLSGYAATNSIAGSLLQLLNLAIGVFIYKPFVQISQKHHVNTTKARIENLVQMVQSCEQKSITPNLLNRNDSIGAMAKNLVSDLQYMLKSKTINLFYQPQVNAQGQIIGAEALLRWKHPIGGYLYPPLVIALAEEAGIGEELGFVILQQACTDLNTLDKLFGHSLYVAVNITATQLENEQCVERLQNLLQQYDFSPEKLCLELTEQTALSSSPAITQRIKAIRNLGVNIVIDDFGMGHNSLIYLQNNQFDMVKLDGALVKNIMTNQRCQDIIASILYLSKSLRFQVLAEFVETLEQKETLEHLGCTNYQGYLYSPAIPLPELTTYIQVHQIKQF